MNAKPRDLLAWGALGAALAVTASAEYSLARACGFGAIVAAGVPAALDIYAVRALRAGRDVAAVVIAMIAVNALAHLVAAGQLRVSVPLVIAVSAIAPLVLWRVHRIGHGAQEETAEENTPAPKEDNTPTPTVPEPVHPTPVQQMPAPAKPLVICGEHLGVPPVPPRPRIESPTEARAVIERAWENGLSIREAARLSTRSTTRVQAVYTELDARRPIEGQTVLELEGAAA